MDIGKTDTTREHVDGWFETESQRLWLFIRSRIGDDANADDLLQQVYLKAVGGTFREGTNFNAWVFKIAHNAIFDFFRGKKKAAASLELSEEAESDSEGLLNLILQSELQMQLRECLSELSENELAVVNARVTGSSHEAIASELNWSSPNRSEKTFHRAKGKLRACLQSKGAGYEGT